MCIRDSLGPRADGGHTHHLVPFFQGNGPHAARRAPYHAHIVLMEPDSHALAGGHQQLGVPVGHAHPCQFVPFVDVYKRQW